MRKARRWYARVHFFAIISGVAYGALTFFWGLAFPVAVGGGVFVLALGLVAPRAFAEPRAELPERTVPWQAVIDRYMADTEPTATVDLLLAIEDWAPKKQLQFWPPMGTDDSECP